jgi:hypothetical protein
VAEVFAKISHVFRERVKCEQRIALGMGALKRIGGAAAVRGLQGGQQSAAIDDDRLAGQVGSAAAGQQQR